MKSLHYISAICLLLLYSSSSWANRTPFASLKSQFVNVSPLHFPPAPSHTHFAQGVASGGVTYTLSYDPYNNSTCVKDADLDGDGLWDMAELELAWAFQPYYIFDEQEEFEEGTVVTYQAMPEMVGDILRVKIRYVLLFPVDSRCGTNHGGDTEQITFIVESAKNEQPDGFFRTWRLVEINTREKTGRMCVRKFWRFLTTLLSHPVITTRHLALTFPRRIPD